MAKSFHITLRRSLIGCTESQTRTSKGLGLKKINDEIKLADNAANRGQILKIQHLINVVVE